MTPQTNTELVEAAKVKESVFNFEVLKRCANAGLAINTANKRAIDALIERAKRTAARTILTQGEGK